ncbi:MAG: hypothetical protein ACYS4W_12160 [Planctomycetota bacterium]|jgi:hypothetical protein
MKLAIDTKMVLELAIRIFLYASLLLVSLVILQALCRRREAFAKLADRVTNLKLGKAVMTVAAGSILVFVLLVAILNTLAAAEIRSFLGGLESCSSIMVTNSGIGPDGGSSETTIITDRETISRLRAALTDVEYKRTWLGGVHACQDSVKMYVYVSHKRGITIAEVAHSMLDIQKPYGAKYRRYFTSDRSLPNTVRIALGLERPAAYRLEEEFERLPISEREAWFRRQELEFRRSEPNSEG